MSEPAFGELVLPQKVVKNFPNREWWGDKQNLMFLSERQRDLVAALPQIFPIIQRERHKVHLPPEPIDTFETRDRAENTAIDNTF